MRDEPEEKDDDEIDKPDKPKKLSESKADKLLELATKRLKKEIKAESDNRSDAVDDLKFLNGEQWEPAEEDARRALKRPVINSNSLRKYINQVVGDMRQNRARIKVRPIDSSGDVDIAKIRSGIIANIEYLSNAEAIYDNAGEMMTSCGYGAWRVLTRYTDENPFLQEIFLERIPNPFTVYLDSSSKSENYADAKYGFVLEKITKEDFEERFPDEELPVNPIDGGTQKGMSDEVWFANDAFFIADYYVIEEAKETLCLMSDGSVVEKPDYEKRLKEWQEGEAAKIASQQVQQLAKPPQRQPGPQQEMQQTPPQQASPQQDQQPRTPVPPPGQAPPPATSPATPVPEPISAAPPPSLTVEKERETKVPKVRHYAICRDQILDGPNDVPGKFIPIILTRGPQLNIEGKTFVRSLIRDAKDAIRLLAYWISTLSEVLAIQPKAPWVGTAKQFEGYEDDYAQANNENYPFLKYNIDQGAPPPQRQNPPAAPDAIFKQIALAQDLVKQAIGMFNSDVGDKGPELSGKAILQQQKPGDVGTFAFIDNLARAIAHCGRVVNEMIPEVYDTQRDVRIKNIDDTEEFAPINTTIGEAVAAVRRDPQRYAALKAQKLAKIAAKKGEKAKYNDITAGKYDVVVISGPSFATQRQESAQALIQLLQAYPAIMGIAGDLVYKFQDFLGAEEIAERIANTMPEQLVPAKEGEMKPQMPLKPEMQVAMGEIQVQQGKLEVEKLKVAVQAEKVKVEKLKAIKEAAGEKGEIKKMLLDLMAEVLGPGQMPGQGQ